MRGIQNPAYRLAFFLSSIYYPMKYVFGFIILFIFSCTTNSSKQETLITLIEDEWHFCLNEYPRFATRTGDTTQNHKLESYTPEDIERREKYYTQLLEKLNTISIETLTKEEKLNYRLFHFYIENEVRELRLKDYRIPILSDYGFHTGFAQLPNEMPMNTQKDYQNYISRLKACPHLFNQHIAWMKQGMADGFTMPKIVLTGYDFTIKSHIVDSVHNSIFFRPFVNFPSSFSDETKNQLIQEATEAILQYVVPTYQNFLEFMNNEYIPNCRQSIGVSDVPNGLDYYAEKVKYYTTLNISIDEVHQIGLKEVARIQQEMDEVIKQTGFKGDREAFIQMLRTDQRFYPKTADELLKEASFIAKKMDGKLPSLFGKLPRQPYGVEPVPAHLAPKFTTGRYAGAPITSKEAGAYWVNTYNLPSRTLYTLEALTLHEAVPGHHLQIALTQELENVPKFRQTLYINAFGEGWGLYAEWLGKEAGFYTNPYSEFGRLTYEMWRACRLVVDTGIHAKGWTRQQAIDYLATNTALSLHECTTETDRYISWPGQALAYKMGELKIKSLRQKAEHELKEKFDVREFHDLVLSNGTVTLPILEEVVLEYIQNKK
jgi:uncharacterized protein (DUF885 family)